jgi:N-methylhydantoinase A/oxoprolinase/acetone carboxylase beta subunit
LRRVILVTILTIGWSTPPWAEVQIGRGASERGATATAVAERKVLAEAARQGDSLKQSYKGFTLIALSPEPGAKLDVTLTTYRGRDPRDFALFVFGGNGGVHAVDLARALQVGRVIVPPAAGVFSAVGLLFADMEMNLARAFMHRVDAMPLDEAEWH